MGYPVVMKVVGPVHKSDIGGVALNIGAEVRVREEYARMMALPEVTAILITKNDNEGVSSSAVPPGRTASATW